MTRVCPLRFKLKKSTISTNIIEIFIFAGCSYMVANGPAIWVGGVSGFESIHRYDGHFGNGRYPLPECPTYLYGVLGTVLYLHLYLFPYIKFRPISSSNISRILVILLQSIKLSLYTSGQLYE